MRFPIEKIERLAGKIRFGPSAGADERILASAETALDKSVKTKLVVLKPDIRRVIMRNPITKLAVAAVVIIACLIGLSFWRTSGSGIALADVLEKVEQVQAFIYKMKTKTTGNVQPGMPSGPIEITGTVLISTEYGTKMDYVMDMNMVVNGASQKMRQIMYMLPQEKKAYVIMPEQKQYIQMEFSDDLSAKMKKQSNDPREFLRQIINSKYTDIGKSVIDGVEVEGFETTDPVCIGGMAEDVKVTLWVDRKTELPVREEMHYKMNEQMQMEVELYDFQWYVQVNADEFKPVIPQDYTNPLPNYKMPTMSEEGAIEGLRFCNQMLGRYPKKIDMMNLMNEVASEFRSIEDSNNPQALKLRERIVEKLGLHGNTKEQMSKLSQEEKTKKIMEFTTEVMRPVQSLAMFYMTLFQEKKEPAYYGETVTPADTDKVLMRWKTSDNEYRVIFGDLRAETVTAEKLAELEAALPK
jgi:outer membrane lipoprotein-sorting protein